MAGKFLGKTVKILVILNPTGYMLAWNLHTFLGRFHSMSERCSYAMISLLLLCIIDGFKIVVPFGLPTYYKRHFLILPLLIHNNGMLGFLLIQVVNDFVVEV